MLSAVFPESWPHSSDAVDGVWPPDGSLPDPPDPDAEDAGAEADADAVGADGVAVGAGSVEVGLIDAVGVGLNDADSSSLGCTSLGSGHGSS